MTQLNSVLTTKESVLSDDMRKKLEKKAENNNEKIEINSDMYLYSCDFCHKLFYRKKGEIEFECPSCHYKYSPEDYINIDDVYNGLLPMDSLIDESIPTDEYIESAEINKLNEDSSQNTSKEQCNILPGSLEYKEYLKDHIEKPSLNIDDDFSRELTEMHKDDIHYEKDDDEIVQEKVIDSEGNEYQDLFVRNEAHESQLKRGYHKGAKEKAMEKAALTPSEKDDVIARTFSIDNELVFDHSVSPDEYEQRLDDYVFSK